MHTILGAVLAGGQSQRMGLPDKFLLPLAGQSLLQRVVSTARPQVDTLVISANGDPERLAEFQLPVIADLWPNHPGPLAGIISVMSWAQKACANASWLATFAADTPFFPRDSVATLHRHAQKQNLEIVYAANERQSHYTFALWSLAYLTELLPELHQRIARGERSLHKAIESRRSARVIFTGDRRHFFNFNSPDDWTRFSLL